MGSRGTGSGKSSGGAKGGSGAKAVSNSSSQNTQEQRLYSEAENAFANADTRKEIRTAVENLVDKLSPGTTFTTAMDISGTGEVTKGSIRTFTISNNKTIANVVSGKEYTTSQFANAIYSGQIFANIIEPGTLSSAELMKKRYGNRGILR